MKTKKTKKGLHQNRNPFFHRIQVKTKKKVFTKNGTLFPPNSRGDLHSDANQSQIIGGNAHVDHTQIIGGGTVKLLGGISPPGFRTLNKVVNFSLFRTAHFLT